MISRLVDYLSKVQFSAPGNYRDARFLVNRRPVWLDKQNAAQKKPAYPLLPTTYRPTLCLCL